MAENPTSAEILKLRRDLQDYVTAIGNGSTIDLYADEANAQIKRDLRDSHGIEWSQVYDDPDYLLDSDGRANNDDRIKNMIAMLAIAYVFRDYSIAVSDSQWFDLYLFYRDEYKTALAQAKLDVDSNDDGTISEGEEQQTTQSFTVR